MVIDGVVEIFKFSSKPEFTISYIHIICSKFVLNRVLTIIKNQLYLPKLGASRNCVLGLCLKEMSIIKSTMATSCRSVAPVLKRFV